MDDQIPTPQVRPVDARRDAINEYERMFEDHDSRIAELLPHHDNEMVACLIEWHREARAILASAIIAERSVTRW